MQTWGLKDRFGCADPILSKSNFFFIKMQFMQKIAAVMLDVVETVLDDS